jgi:hypothetical protein
MNSYYLFQNKLGLSCEFNSNAALKVAESTSMQGQALFSRAMSDGTGPITSSVGHNTGSPWPTNQGSPTSSAATGRQGSKKFKGSVSTGAIAGIAVGVVFLAAIAAILAFISWRRCHKERGPPESGEGRLKVGSAPPLKKAEPETNGQGQCHEVKAGHHDD